MRAISTDALVLVDKPSGITSFDVVRSVSRAIGTRKAGHTGTLDPLATGLLVVLTGRGTRLIRFVPGEPKVYRATIQFGEERDTDDAAGAVRCEAPPPNWTRLEGALRQLTGDIEQLPPAYSAKKVDGRRAYAIARHGISPHLAPALVRVDRWEVLDRDHARLVVRIACGGGTYIRALARDLGRLLDSAAHVADLRRERSGPFDVAMASPWEVVQRGQIPTRPLSDALGDVCHEVLTAEDVGRVVHGMQVDAQAQATRAALFDPQGALVAVARRENDRWQPEVVLADA
ncbi:MAG: tRNA pseudouridine(55) synthase TruB [Gemmatimonadaceae bacterium]